jgi:hypothetical protein
MSSYLVPGCSPDDGYDEEEFEERWQAHLASLATQEQEETEEACQVATAS